MNHLGALTQDQIKDYVYSNSIQGTALCMMQIERDINFSNIVRTCNALGIQNVYYFGNNRKWDRRGAVGTYKYTAVTHISTESDLHKLMADYHTVAVEQHEGSVELSKFVWPKNPMMIIGEESNGLPQSVLDHCDSIVTIPQIGSVRSLNAATAAGITIWDFCCKM